MSMPKHQLHNSILSWDIAETWHSCYFEYFKHVWCLTTPIKNDSIIYRKLWCSLHKKSTSSLTSFLRYCRDFAFLLFWVIWACLVTTSKMILSAYQLDPSVLFFWDIFWDITLKNPAIWLVKNILENNSRTRIPPEIEFATESQELKKLSF